MVTTKQALVNFSNLITKEGKGGEKLGTLGIFTHIQDCPVTDADDHSEERIAFPGVDAHISCIQMELPVLHGGRESGEQPVGTARRLSAFSFWIQAVRLVNPSIIIRTSERMI